MSQFGVGAENPPSHGNTESRQTRTASEKNLRPQTPSAEKARLLETFGKLPLRFEANRGQTDSRVKFLSQGRGYTLFLTGGEAVLSLAKPSSDKHQGARAYDSLSVKLLGANADAAVSGLEELPTKSNYFIGRDPQKWRTNVPNYGKVRYKDVYPGVDLIYYGNQQQLEYDWVVAPGADPRAIRFAIENGNPKLETGNSKLENGQSDPSPESRVPSPESVRIDANGDLVIATEGGEVRFRKPVVYQVQSAVDSRQSTVKDSPNSNRQSPIGNRQFLDGRFILRTSNPKSKIQNPKSPSTQFEVAFEVVSYDPSKPLIIDPILTYSTYLGGTGQDVGRAIAVAADSSDSSIHAYVTGTAGANFPLSSAFQGTEGGGGDAFVSKFSADGASLIYSTYLGGNGSDEGFAITVDSSGNAYVAGTTFSTNFPGVTGNADSTCGSDGACNPLVTVSTFTLFSDAFVAKINSTGSGITFATYLGGNGTDFATGIALGPGDTVYVTGGTGSSSDFPAVNAFQTSLGGAFNAFMTKIKADGSGFDYSTFYGGTTGSDSGSAIAADSSGNAYITGTTSSDDFPTSSLAFDTTCGADSLCNGGTDSFVVKIDPTLSGAGSRIYATFLGGSGSDIAQGITVDSSFNAYVSGWTNSSTDFPLVNALQSIYGGGGSDAFITELNAAGSDALFSTFLGGGGTEEAPGVALDSTGNIFVAGNTRSSDFPLASATQATFMGGTRDVFLTKLNSTASAIIFSTFLGGTGDDSALGLAVDTSLDAYVTGTTTSGAGGTTVFPTANAFQGTLGGGTQDAFVAKLSDLVLPVATVTPASLDFLSIGIGFTSSTQTVTLKNNGDNTLGVFSIAITSDIDHPDASDFTISSGTCPLFSSFSRSPGASCTIDVAFAPTVASARGALLEITDNAEGSPHIVTLTGIGALAPVAGILPSSLSLVFAPRLVGTTSAAQPVTLTNNGTVPMTVSNISTGVDFAQTNDCPDPLLEQSLAIGASCTINVTFTPTIAGSIFGSLTITSDAPGSPHVVSLSGTGLAPAVSFSPSFLAFGKQPPNTTSSAQSVTVTNSGTSPLNITNIQLTNSQFALAGGTCTTSTTLQINQNCTIKATFTPSPATACTLISGNVTVTSDVVTGSSSLFLQGQVGSANGLVVTSLGTQSPATLVNNLLGPGVTVSNVTYSGTSLSSGTFTGGDGIIGFGSGIILSSGLATNVIGPNCGDGTTGANGLPGDADLTALSGFATFDATLLEFDFVPATNTLSFQYVFTSEEYNEFANSGVSNVFGFFVNGTNVALIPGTSTPVAINNVNGGNPFGTNAQNAEFFINNDVSDGGGSINTEMDGLTVVLTAQVTVNAGQVNHIKLGISDAGDSIFDSNVFIRAGSFASAPTLALSATAVTMPNTPINLTCVPRVVTLTNTSQGPVAISSIATSAEFTETTTCPLAPSTLAAGASCTVSVVFHPAAIGTRTGTLTITSNAAGSPQVVTLTGEGLPLCLLQAVAPTLKVVPGTDSATFDVFHEVHGATELIEDPNVLACVDAAPVRCSFNPQAIQNPQHSRMTVENLRAMGGNGKALKVTGNSAEEKHTMFVQVLFADFTFTKFPNEASVRAGETASYALSIVPVNGLAGRMALKCTGVPVGTSCTVTPGEVTLEGGPVQVGVKVRTTRRGMAPDFRPRGPSPDGFPAPDSRLPLLLWSVLALLAAATGLAITKKVVTPAKAGAKLALGLAMLCVLTWGSCGGGGGVGPEGAAGGTPLGTHTLVIQGTLATPGAGVVTDTNTPPLTHEVQLKLKVN